MPKPSNQLKAGLAKTFAKQRAKEAELRQKDTKPQPDKPYVKTITNKQQRDKKRRDAIADEEAAAHKHDHAPALIVLNVDGSTTPATVARKDVLAFLRARDGHGEASVDEIRAATGIDLVASVEFYNELHHNKHIEVVEVPGGATRFRFYPPYGIRNAAALEHLLSQRDFEGVSQNALCETEEGAGGKTVYFTYRGVERDIARLLERGVIHAVDKRCGKSLCSGCKLTEDCRSCEACKPPGGSLTPKLECLERRCTNPRDRILYAKLCHPRAPAALMDMWNKVVVPRGEELEKELVARKLRTKEFFDEKRAKHAARAAAMAAEKAAGKKRKRSAIRKMTNEHLREG